MRVLQKVDLRRKQMLHELGKQGLLKGDLHRSLQASGVKEGIGAMQPDRFRPPIDHSQSAMQKWVQAALNVILGTRLKLDGSIGPVTRQALRRFQQQEGLTPHGYADEATLQALELRVGVACPRGGSHEPVPSLLVLPMRGVWMPKPKGQGGKERKTAGEATSEAGAREGAREQPADAPSTAPGAMVEDPVQREALGAVRALAFADGFVGRALEYLHEGEVDPAATAGMRGEMERWLHERLQTPHERQPEWVQRMRSEARANSSAAASTLRQRWWAEHIGESEGM